MKSGNCLKCGTYRLGLHRDHVIPRWKWKQQYGGLVGDWDADSNIQFICANCHQDKSREDLRGVVRSKETCKRISDAKRGKPNLKLRGIVRSEESKRKNAESHRGKRATVETRKALSEAGKQRWKNMSEAERVSIGKAISASWNIASAPKGPRGRYGPRTPEAKAQFTAKLRETIARRKAQGLSFGRYANK